MITLEQSVLLQDLSIWTDYAVVVQAFNLAGEGPKSDVIYQKTKEGCELLCQAELSITASEIFNQK